MWFFFSFFFLLLYWGYTVTFTKVLIKYHSWIHPLHHSPPQSCLILIKLVINRCYDHLPVSLFFFFFGGTRVWTQGLTLATQAFYSLSQSTSPQSFMFQKRKSEAWSSYRLWTRLSTPKDYFNFLPGLENCLFKMHLLQAVSQSYYTTKLASKI
jgi:hypothetical protein